ncbi:MAG: hypothetical protein RI988_883, partial [Pseudomonadota bacterium]
TDKPYEILKTDWNKDVSYSDKTRL